MKHIQRLLISFMVLLLTVTVTPEMLPGLNPVLQVQAAKVKLSKSKASLVPGQTLQLKVKGTKKKAKWSSSKKSVATVSSKGKVTAKAGGKATITAKIGSKKYKCTVTVKSPKLSSKAVTLVQGETHKLTLKNTKQKITWSSSNRSVATVNKSGLIRAKKTGKATITAKAGSKKYKCTVTVKSRIPEPEYPEQEYPEYPEQDETEAPEQTQPEVPSGNLWDHVEVVIPETIGEQGYETNRMKILEYVFFDEYSYSDDYEMNIKFQMVQYGKKGRNNWGEDVYFYDKNGRIIQKRTLYASGLALNKIFIDDMPVPAETAKIEFMEWPSEVPTGPVIPTPGTPSTPDTGDSGAGQTGTLTLNKSTLTLEAGKTETLTASVSLSDKTIIWSSSDEETATVKDGVVTAVAAGTAVITASSADGSCSDTCTVTVVQPVQSLTSVYQQLRMSIYQNGYSNTDGDKVISISDYNDGMKNQWGIIYDLAKDTLTFSFTSDGGNVSQKSAVNMEVDLSKSDHVEANVICLLQTTRGFESKATIQANTYTGNSNVYFTKVSTLGITNSQIQSVSNAALKLAFAGWDLLLYQKAQLSLNAIGFTAYQ